MTLKRANGLITPLSPLSPKEELRNIIDKLIMT